MSHLAARLVPWMLAALLTGCAGPRSYVVLLPSPDGSVGRLQVQGPRGAQILSQAQTGVAMDGGTPAFEVSQEKLERDFGAAMAARPALPEQFLLYFESGGSLLTVESQALLSLIVAHARARQTVDLSVVGHTDTLGLPDTNHTLAMERALAIAEQLQQLGLQDSQIVVESHGERNLLVPTPDETSEPRNRRVEVTLR